MNQKRFEAIYRLYYEDLLSFAKHQVSDFYLAEDLVQDAFLFFFEQGMTDVPSVEQTLYSILISLLERNLQRPVFELSFIDDILEHPNDYSSVSFLFQNFSQNQMEQNKNKLLQESIEELSFADRTLLTLYYLEEKNAKEIGILFSISHCAVRKRLERIKKKLLQIYLQQTGTFF